MPTSAPINVAAIKEEDGAIIEAIDRQSQRVDDIATDRALLIESLEQETSASETDSSTSPIVLTVSGESGSGSIWAASAAGIAIGLSVAALIAIRPALRRQKRAGGLDVLQPSTES